LRADQHFHFLQGAKIAKALGQISKRSVEEGVGVDAEEIVGWLLAVEGEIAPPHGRALGQGNQSLAIVAFGAVAVGDFSHSGMVPPVSDGDQSRRWVDAADALQTLV